MSIQPDDDNGRLEAIVLVADAASACFHAVYIYVVSGDLLEENRNRDTQTNRQEPWRMIQIEGWESS